MAFSTIFRLFFRIAAAVTELVALTGEAKVSNPHIIGFAKKDVLSLEVAM